MKQLTLAFLSCLTSMSAWSLTISAGSTHIISTYHAEYDDIIIEHNAILSITGELRMAPGKSIIINDGGRLVGSSNGSISALGNDPWGGIKMKGGAIYLSNPLAVYMDRFSVKDAETALHYGYAASNSNQIRNTVIKNTVFDNNDIHIKTSYGAQFPALSSRYIYFNGCEFLSANTDPAIRFFNGHQVSFLDCRFDFQYAGNIQTGIDAWHQTDLLIKNCEFERVGYRAIRLYRRNSNSRIENNTFRVTDIGNPAFQFYGYDHYDIEVDCSNHAVSALTISGNTFYGHSGYSSAAVLCHSSYGTNNTDYGSAQYNGIRIENNTVFKHTTAVDISNCTGEQSDIAENHFHDGITGVLSRKNNPQLKLQCNEIDKFAIGIHILAGSLQNHAGYDHHNRFKGVLTDIKNGGSTLFFYDRSSINAHPPTVFSGLILPLWVNNIKKCAPTAVDFPNKLTREHTTMSSSDTPIRAYPNPVLNQLTIENQADDTMRYAIFDATGKMALSGEISQTVQLDLSFLP